jgi:dihydrofolate reductase
MNMRKLIATEYVTLDGVMEAPGGETSLGALSGWSFTFWNDEAAKYKSDELFASDTFLLGRVTYQIFADAWPSRTGEFADRMNSTLKLVVSRTLDKVAWNNSRLLKGKIIEEVTKLKQQPGQGILIYGSADLVHLLMQHDLIDEYRIMVFPVVLGVGKRLFEEGKDKKVLKLVETRTFSTGMVLLTYQPERKA